MSRAPPNSTAGSAPAHAVKVTSTTWGRDSHDLFDFEAKHVHSRSFDVRSSTTFVRTEDDVDVRADGAGLPQGADSLIRVVERGGSYWVSKATAASAGARKLWVVVRDVATKGYRLTKDDIIKLGRFKFRVRQLVTSEDGEPELDLGLEDTTMTLQVDREEDVESKPCRICLMEGPGENDPLIKPCQCRGSIQYVHLKCLRYWTKSRLSLGESRLGSYNYKPLPCELCKATFPTYMIDYDGARSPLMELPKTQPPYIVLESMTTVRGSGQHSRCLHVMSLAEKSLVLGRGHESDLRIADVSISRCHASIRFEDGQFLLQDNESKFGTLVAMKRGHQIEASKPISVQIGRTVLKFSLHEADGPSGAIGDIACGVLEPPAESGVMEAAGDVALARAVQDDMQRRFRLLFLSQLGGAEGGAGDTDGMSETGALNGSETAGAQTRRHMSF
eukprot:CAMPEP_0176076332 /NCGR_PEP_ID=MMETSP0120_2-20121206/38158_1 /TAXON_ID=160619 /ORGANISM="Kryptoperidinium foliaceum, Strain CCMP 1326" /LENGTH=445 /DNA_ID=CAMNT_0017410049 /DNA_START=95 /DNA_END=1432 /DNA_ORIENTATION=+